MASIRPFEFKGLRQYSRQDIALQAALATYFARRPFKRRLGKDLAIALDGVIDGPWKISTPETSVVQADEVFSLLPHVTCVAVVGAAPTEHKILVDLDTQLVAHCIDRLLGGRGKVSRIMRPLTEIEQGVLSFPALKVLDQVTQGWQSGREISLTLDRFEAGAEALRSTIEAEASYHCLSMKVAAGKVVGHARILLPRALVQAAFSADPNSHPSTPEDLEHMRRVLTALGPSYLRARCEAATIDLSDEDLAGLEAGDIIILENHELQMTEDGLVGGVFVRLGSGVNGGLRGQLLNQGDLVKLQIAEIVVAEQPAEEPMEEDAEQSLEEAAAELEEGEGPPPPPADNLEETEGLLRDVAAPVVVELGRVKLNTNQVIKLRAGQVLRLPRGPNDPVNLVVNGKLFARGELIEVDGELGVRLLQVAGQG